MLSQIKDHYRNPLIAAESSTSLDDALSLFNMASALITLMAGQIREQQPVETKKDPKPSATHQGSATTKKQRTPEQHLETVVDTFTTSGSEAGRKLRQGDQER